MKKIIIGIAIIVILVVVIIAITGSGEKISSEFTKQKQNETSNTIVDDNGTYSGKISATNQYVPTENAGEKRIDYTISTVADLYPSGEINKVLIKNVQLEKMPEGDVTLLLPTGEYNQKFTNDGSNVIGIMAVSEGEQFSANKVGKTSAPLFLQIKVSDAYSFTNADAAGPHRSFQYAEVNPSDLDNTLTFDVEIELSSGGIITKSFSGSVNGEEFVKSGSVAAQPLDVR